MRIRQIERFRCDFRLAFQHSSLDWVDTGFSNTKGMNGDQRMSRNNVFFKVPKKITIHKKYFFLLIPFFL